MMAAEQPSWLNDDPENPSAHQADNPFEDPSVDAAKSERPKALEQDVAGDETTTSSSTSTAPPSSLKDKVLASILPAPATTSPQRPPDGKLPWDYLQMRGANVLGVGMMFLVALLNFFFGATMTTAILSLYALAFSCMLCCFEVKLEVIAAALAKNFGFMYRPVGRLSFLLCCGGLMFSLDSLLGWIVGAYVVALVPANIYILLKYPHLEKQPINFNRGPTASLMGSAMKLSRFG